MNTIFIFLVVAILAIFIIAQVIFKKLQNRKFSEAESNSDIEQMVNAYKNGLKYKRARTRLWELMIIVPAIIALLGFGGYFVASNYQNIRILYPHFLKAPAEFYYQEYEKIQRVEGFVLRIIFIISIVFWSISALILESKRKRFKDCNEYFILKIAVALISAAFAGCLLVLMAFCGCTQAEWISVLIIYAICYFLYRLNVKKSKI